MNKFFVSIIVLASMLCAGWASAECVEPVDVVLPDGVTATTAEMVEGQANVKQYVIDAQAFLACMDEQEQEQASADTVTEDDKKANVARYNTTVDRMQAAAQGFNEQIKAYKEVQAAE